MDILIFFTVLWNFSVFQGYILKGKCPKNKQELKTVPVEAWQSITRDETQRLVMSMHSKLQAVIDCKGFATKY